MRFIAAILAMASTAAAYAVTAPTNTTGFFSQGANTVSWTCVSSDAGNFSIYLVNETINPPTSQELLALERIDNPATDCPGSVNVNPPSGGWPSGSGFQINLINPATSGILAQSQQFSFKSGTSGVSSVSSSSSGATSIPGGNPYTNTVPPSTLSVPANTDSLNPPSPSQSETGTSPSNNGAASTGAHAALFGLVALVGAVLA